MRRARSSAAHRLGTLFGIVCSLSVAACATSVERLGDGGPVVDASTSDDAAGATDGGALTDSSILLPPVACDTLTAGTLRRLDAFEYANAYRDLVGTPPPVALPETIWSLSHVGDPFVNAEALEALHRNAVAARMALASGCEAAPDARACVEGSLRDFAPRVLRRPVSAAQIASLMALVDVGATTAEGYGAAIEALFLSPYFVMHVELGRDEDRGTGEAVRLTPHEIASRLSFSLLGTTPDARSRAMADAGLLDEPAERSRFVEEVLSSREAVPGIRRFHQLWLEYAHPGVASSDEALARSLVMETDTFVDHVIFDADGRLATLLGSPYSFLDARAAAHYGVAGGATPFERVELPSERFSSVLTHASILSRFTSPTTRGVWVTRNLACRETPPPPPDIVPTIPTEGTTERELYESLVADPACASCHQVLDPVGFGFLGFDREGRPRDSDAGRPIDDSGRWGETAFEGPAALAALLATDDDVEACVTERFMTYTLRRPIDREGGDRCGFESALQAFRDSSNAIPALVVAHVASPIFVLRAPLPRPSPTTVSRSDTPLAHAAFEASALISQLGDDERAVLEYYVDVLRELEARLGAGP